MTIVEAIMKAKLAGQAEARTSKAAAVGKAPARATAAARTTGAAPGVVTERNVLERAVGERPSFPVLAYDEAICASSHIIALTTDMQLWQSASPPYRMLRARLLQRCRENQWSTVAVTSPGPGEGKSVTALNLALTIAREGNYDVFLLDLDLRKPSICRYLGVTPRSEITAYFAGAVAAPELFFTLEGVERLTIAGGTASIHHASEQLANNHLEALFDYIRSISANPLIMLDLPPVLNTDDALVVAPRIDATIMVVSEGVTRRDSLVRAVGLLAEFPVAGIALNRASQSIGAEYYGY
jgi:protein-tyrosine kinase